jgi:hypothetical protein
MGFTLTRSVSPQPFTPTTLVWFSELEPEFSSSFEEPGPELESQFHLCVELEPRQFFCFWFFPFLCVNAKLVQTIDEKKKRMKKKMNPYL